MCLVQTRNRVVVFFFGLRDEIDTFRYEIFIEMNIYI